MTALPRIILSPIDSVMADKNLCAFIEKLLPMDKTFRGSFVDVVSAAAEKAVAEIRSVASVFFILSDPCFRARIVDGLGC